MKAAMDYLPVRFYILFFTFLALFSCSQPPQETTQVESSESQQISESAELENPDDILKFSGTLNGPQNTPLKWSRVFITSYSVNSTDVEEILTPNENGSFEANLIKGKVNEVTFSSPLHESLTILFGPDLDTDLALDVSLDASRYQTNPENVGLTIYDGDRTERHSLVETEPGKFTITLEKEAGDIQYDLTGISLASRAMRDPNADKFGLDEDDRWIAFKNHAGGEFVYEFNIETLQTQKAEQRLVFQGEWPEDLKEQVTLQAELRQLRWDKYFHDKKSQDASKIYEPGIELIRELLEKNPAEVSQQLIYAYASGLYTDPDTYHNKAVELVPASSWIWLIGTADFLYSITIATTNNDRDLLMSNLIETYQQKMDEINIHLDNSYSDEAAGSIYMDLAYAHKNEGRQEEYEFFFNVLKEKYSHIDRFEWYSSLLEQKRIRPGVAFPEFSIASISEEGVTYTNATFTGKYVLMDFWGTWCPPCIKELPALQSAYEDFNNKGFEILGFNADETVETFHEFREGRWSMPWKHVFIGLDDDDIREYYNIVGYPTAYLVGPDGKVLATGEDVKGSNLAETLTLHMSAE